MSEQNFPEPTPPTEPQPAYNSYTPAPPQTNPYFAPPPPAKKRGHPALWAVPALIVGIIGGAAIGSGATSQADAAKPIPTVTQTQTQVQTKTVTQTPSACISALSKADAVMSDYYSVVKTVSPAISAIQAGDVSGLNDATAEVKRLNPILQSDLSSYQSYASQCKTY
jgi:hypothetical protein